MNTYKIETYKDRVATFGGSITVLDENEAKRDDNIILDVRDDAKNYIRDAYERMQFISNDETGEVSIYYGDKGEDLRNLEYEMYQYNLISIESKDDLDSVDISLIPYQYRAVIIEDMAQKKAYKNSYGKISKILKDIENTEKYSYLSKDEKEKIREKLIYKKYEEKFKMLNQEYNGLLTEELYMDKVISQSEKLNFVPLMLNLSQDDFDKFYDSMVLEYLAVIKEDVKGIFMENREKRKRENSSNRVGNLIVEAKGFGNDLVRNGVSFIKNVKKKSSKPEFPENR